MKKKWPIRLLLLLVCGSMLLPNASIGNGAELDVNIVPNSASFKENKQQFNKKWSLKYQENFNRQLSEKFKPWVRDPQGDQSPWNVDHLDDDGKYFQVLGGNDFLTQLNSFDVLRKRMAFGKDGWLTLEMAARDYNKDGKPDNPPSFTNVRMPNGERAAKLDEPSHDTGIIIHSTEALPSEYRIEYTLLSVDFGGKRNGTFDYDGKSNGYKPEGCKSNWPWKRSGSFTGPTNQCNPNFGDVKNENGFYYLGIMDYKDPAPHNNLFIHNHRKVSMDGYNTNATWAKNYAVCNPSTRQLYSYTATESTYNGINAIFMAGDSWRDKSFGYNEFMFETPCGSYYPPKSVSIVSSAEIQPTLMPNETYKFAIERDKTGYTMEMSGNFLYVGQQTYRVRRDFIQDGRPIWHYNNKPEQYEGQFNDTLTFSGPYGSYSVEQWPKGSAYPDYFIIGEPHFNYYEGSAIIDDVRLYVPKK